MQRWFDAIAARPALVQADALAREYNQVPTVTDASRDLPFNQRARP